MRNLPNSKYHLDDRSQKKSMECGSHANVNPALDGLYQFAVTIALGAYMIDHRRLLTMIVLVIAIHTVP
jgi:hypothetical protein